MKNQTPINATNDGCAYAVKASYSKNVSLSTLTGGVDTTLAREFSNVEILGLWSPTSQIGGRVIGIDGIAPTVMAGTHGYGFGCVLVYEDIGSD